VYLVTAIISLVLLLLLLLSSPPPPPPPPPNTPHHTQPAEAVASPVAVDKPRKRLPGIEDLTHPLLGDAPTLKLLPDPSKVRDWLLC
jgi:hypothetical protein